MNVAAEEILRLVLCDELADRVTSPVDAFPDSVQRGAKRRAVADQDQRLKRREPAEPPGDLRFTVFARSVEGSGVGVSEAGHLVAANSKRLLVKGVAAELCTKRFDPFCRFVISGQDVQLFGDRLKDLSASVQLPAPACQITGGEVAVGLNRNQAFEGGEVGMNVGED